MEADRETEARLIGVTQRQQGHVLSWMHLAGALGPAFLQSNTQVPWWPYGHTASAQDTPGLLPSCLYLLAIHVRQASRGLLRTIGQSGKLRPSRCSTLAGPTGIQA